jgi:sugar-phosphatase
MTPTHLPAQAVLFDCDGVLVDSDASVRTAWTRWARRYGFDPDTVVDQVHGRRTVDTVRLLVPDRYDAALADINRIELEDAAGVTAIPGAAALTAQIAALDGPPRWAVVTSGTRALATARLAAAGIRAPLVLVSADDVTHGKPAPEGYQLAAGQLGVPASATLVLEDAPSGVEAARSAGVGAIVSVGNRRLEGDISFVVADLQGVRWARVDGADGLLITG